MLAEFPDELRSHVRLMVEGFIERKRGLYPDDERVVMEWRVLPREVGFELEVGSAKTRDLVSEWFPPTNDS